MNLRIRSACFILAAGLAIGLTDAASGEAHDAMKSTAIECSKADAMMMQPGPSTQEMKPSGNVDKDFAQSMMMHDAAMMAMLKTEIMCGKDPKTKAMAQKILDQVNVNDGFLRQLIGGAG